MSLLQLNLNLSAAATIGLAQSGVRSRLRGLRIFPRSRCNTNFGFGVLPAAGVCILAIIEDAQRREMGEKLDKIEAAAIVTPVDMFRSDVMAAPADASLNALNVELRIRQADVPDVNFDALRLSPQDDIVPQFLEGEGKQGNERASTNTDV